MFIITCWMGRYLSGCFLLAACLGVMGCGSDPGPLGSSSAAGVAASEPEFAVRSDYYSAEVEAELLAGGLNPQAFRQGQRYYELYCTNCHVAPKSAAASAPGNLLGPPSYAVAAAYRQAYPDAGQRSAEIASFTAKPSEESALMGWAVERYGLMAPMPLSESQLEAISVFLATAEFVKPGWFELQGTED
ncbi:MAG: hypothetical protein ACNA77_02495 [Opitutales bacterium]